MMGFRVWLRRTSNNTLETELMISAWDTMNRSNHLVAILPMRDLANEARKSMSSYARTRVLPVILSASAGRAPKWESTRHMSHRVLRLNSSQVLRSEERRVGKEWRVWWLSKHE